MTNESGKITSPKKLYKPLISVIETAQFLTLVEHLRFISGVNLKLFDARANRRLAKL